MKKFAIIMTLSLLASLAFGCGPVKVEQFENIAPNETAFLVPLEGATKSNQKNFFSEKYLNENKVATKRVSLPLREHKTGRMWWEFEYIPTMSVIKVNRTPVTREWTGDKETGTSSKNEALWVESSDSIGFGVGVNITAMVTEENAAQFLYKFAGKPLETLVDENVRGKVNSILSREFAKYPLENGRKQKNQIFSVAAEETIDAFKDMGVTITNLGLAEGLVYEDKEIQQAINDTFTAEMQEQIETQRNKAQAKVNIRNVGIATAEKDAALQFKQASEARAEQVNVEIKRIEANAKIKWIEKWNGELPNKILPEGSKLLLNLDQ